MSMNEQATMAATAQPLNQATPESVLQRIDWTVLRRLDGLLQGDYRTLFYGAGIDFADLREYQPQDDSRHIDWNVTARMDTPYVRQYVEDRDITAWFLLDVSPSMGFGPVNRPKERILIDIVTALSRLLTRNGNRVGAILYNESVEQTLPPRSGRNQVLRLTRALIEEADAVSSTTTDLNQLLSAGLNTVKRRSLVFVISDFISEPGWERTLALLNRRHELVAIRLYDPHEMELPDAGVVVIEDAETGEQLYVDTSNPTFRANYQAAAQEQEAQIRSSLKRAGAAPYAISTEDDLVAALVRMAGLRKRQF